MIKKTFFDRGSRPELGMYATVKMIIDNPNSDVAFIEISKGSGRPATIKRTEVAFVKFLIYNYGTGKYTIQRAEKKLKNFFNGPVEEDRWFRDKGVMSPYLKTKQSRQWHFIEDNENKEYTNTEIEDMQ